MVKTDTKIEIKCPCNTTTITKFKPANAYVEHTIFTCGCGRTYTIRDYRNGITTYMEN
jgi:hypothetical protein